MGGANTKKVVILGKSGAGKSSVANTIFGKDVFKIGHSPNSKTSECEAKTRSVNGRSITLIDTPDFFDTDKSEEELKSEIVRCITKCAPGPHAFLIVLKVEKFTEHEQAVIDKIQEYFTEEVFKYSTVLFTHGDQLPDKEKIENYVHQNSFLSDLVKKCGGRCHVIDNKYWKRKTEDEYRNNRFQVKELLNTIDKMIMENNGSCYTNKLRQEVEEEIHEEIQQEEQIGQTPEHASEEENEEQAEDSNRRIVILGKTGAGKSSLTNTIFDEDEFKIDDTLNSRTSKCQTETRSVSGKRVSLIDTPGLFDTDKSEEELKSEIVRCITECAPGPHAFLIVLKVERFTDHDQAVIKKIQEYFSEEVFKYSTVVFTHGDQLPEREKIENYVHQNSFLSDLVKKCGGRCQVIDNKYWNKNTEDEYRNNRFQVKELLNKIDTMMMENNGRCYTNTLRQEVEEEIQEEDEQIGQTSERASEEEIEEQAEDSNRRIVILGKTGAGKSSLANTIFGEEEFKIDNSLNSGTSKCQTETKSINEKRVTLIDTPGLFDTDRPEEELKPEILRCITECAPGPHAFLIVLKVEKFTKLEQDVINKIPEYFSEEAFKYATVVFTHGEQLPDGETIENYVQKNKSVSDLVNKCGGRCHVIDNKYWNRNTEDENRSNKFQVEKLLKTLEKMVTENNGKCFTNEMLQAVEREIQQEEERIRLTSENMSDEEIRAEAKGRVFKKLSVRLTGIATGVLMGAFCGVALPVVLVFIGAKSILKNAGAARVVAAVATAGGSAAGGAAVIAGAAGGAAAGGAAAIAGAAGGGAVGGAAAIAGAAEGGTVAAAAVGGAAAIGAAGIVLGTLAAVGVLAGGVAGYRAVKGAETPKEAAEKTYEAFKKGAQTVEDGVTNILTKIPKPKFKENKKV